MQIELWPLLHRVLQQKAPLSVLFPHEKALVLYERQALLRVLAQRFLYPQEDKMLTQEGEAEKPQPVLREERLKPQLQAFQTQVFLNFEAQVLALAL